MCAQLPRFDAGADFGYLLSSQMGFGVYRALGFEQVSEYRIFTAEGEHKSGL